jgi:hypothetical protein
LQGEAGAELQRIRPGTARVRPRAISSWSGDLGGMAARPSNVLREHEPPHPFTNDVLIVVEDASSDVSPSTVVGREGRAAPRRAAPATLMPSAQREDVPSLFPALIPAKPVSYRRRQNAQAKTPNQTGISAVGATLLAVQALST